jgi:DMSO/TMAO reductase YedYZ molybdopterin-dependent catalytic subunit
MGQAEWTGVRLADVLDDAGVESGAAHVGLAGGDLPSTPRIPAFHRSLPLAKAVHPETLIALEMNGRPLDLNHGAPARLVVPGWAGDHWMKWLTQVVARPDEDPGYFMQKAYRIPKEPVSPGSVVPLEETKPLHEVPIKSVIARPSEGDVVPVGPQEIVGVAFSGYGQLESVEVSVDGGSTWETAQLEGESGTGRWQVFRSRPEAKGPGPMTAYARARDSAGNIQPEQAQWNPSGYLWNGWQKVTWSVI